MPALRHHHQLGTPPPLPKHLPRLRTHPQNQARRMSAKDRRLYARFDIGMDEHPKVALLSDAAFRALIESTMYARRQLTDGFLDGRIVGKKWGADVAEELTHNDPDKPSWSKVTGGYQIHDFGEHQTTTTDIAAKREAGRAGGLAKAKQKASTFVAPAKHVPGVVLSKPLAKTETETETLTTDVVSGGAHASGDPGQMGSRIPANFTADASMIRWAQDNAPNVNLKLSTQKFKSYHRSVAGRAQFKTDWTAAWEAWLLSDQQRALDRPQQFKTAAEKNLEAGAKLHQLYTTQDQQQAIEGTS